MRFSLKVSMSIQALSEASFYKKALSWVLSYGIIFSYPGWVYFNRVAHAGTSGAPKNPNGGIVEPKATGGAKAPVPTVQPTPPPPPSGDGKGHVPVDGRYKPMTMQEALAGMCDSKYLQTHFQKAGDIIKQPPVLCSELTAKSLSEDEKLVKECWSQLYLTLGGVYSAGFYKNNPGGSAANAADFSFTQSTEQFSNMFPPTYSANGPKSIYEELSAKNSFQGNWKSVTTSFSKDLEAKKAGDQNQCCHQMVNQVRKVAQLLKDANKIPTGSETLFVDSFEDTRAQQCGEQTNDGGKAPVADVGAHAKNPGNPILPPPPAPAPEKKKNNTLLAVLLGIGVAVIAAVLINKKSKKNKNKKKHKKHKKKKKEPVDPGCGDSGCTSTTGEGTTTGATTEGTSTGTSTGETSTGGTVTGASTYSDGDNILRPVSTGGTGSDGYSDDDNRGRGSTTGATGGSITGSTTAGETTGSNGGATDGGDTFSPGDNNPRTTGGDVRLAPQSQNSKTLIKSKPAKN